MSRVIIAAVGLLTFAVVYVALQVAPRAQPAAVEATSVIAADARMPRLETGRVAVALPLASSEPLVRGLPPGARLNVLASLPEPDSGRPRSAVVARGATVLQPLASGEALLVEVEPTDAIVLAHLVLGGTQLNYALWSGGAAPPEVPPLDERTARALLGLPARAMPTPEPTLAPPPMPPPTPLPPPTAVVPRGPAADRYVVQPEETLASIATQLGIGLDRLRAANPNVPDTEPLPPGMQLVVPQ